MGAYRGGPPSRGHRCRRQPCLRMGPADRRLHRLGGTDHQARGIDLRNEVTAVIESANEKPVVTPRRLPMRWLLAALPLLVVATAAGMLFGAKSLPVGDVLRAV